LGLESLTNNIVNPPVLFFFLGLLAIAAKSDLEIPSHISKGLSLYLLFDIGIKGGEELFHSGFSWLIVKVMAVCILLSFLIPFIVYQILRIKLDVYNAGAIAAAYGSVSAVTFATSVSYLESSHIYFGGYMVAGMALMESPAIIAGLLIIGLELNKQAKKVTSKPTSSKTSLKPVLHEACFNGPVFLLLGSLVIGLVSGSKGQEELKPFVSGIFKGMLSLYMLDMGILAGRRLGDLKKSGPFLVVFALFYPIIFSFLGILMSYLLSLSPGDGLLMTVLVASSSYIAVPAAMRMAVPKANMSLLIPMSLGVTFTFNVTLGIPLYFSILTKVLS
jgi:hypothetical protein